MRLLAILFTAWLVVLLSGTIGAFVALAWVLIGISFVISTVSRGFLADALFVFAWPIHLIAYWSGRE